MPNGANPRAQAEAAADWIRSERSCWHLLRAWGWKSTTACGGTITQVRWRNTVPESVDSVARCPRCAAALDAARERREGE